MKRFGKTAAARVGTAAFLSALRVLVREHPGVAVEMAGAGAVKAGKTGLAEARGHLTEGGRRED